MISNTAVFLKCQTNSNNIFELAGNFFLSPVRYFWEGRTVKIGRLQSPNPKLDNVLDMHVLREKNQHFNEPGIYKLLHSIALIIGFVPGVLLKGVALMSPAVRERHFALKETLSSPKNLPEGITIACDNNAYPQFTLSVDLAKYQAKEGEDLEEYVAKKLLQVKPNLSIGDAGKFSILNPHMANLKLDGSKSIKLGPDKEFNLSLLLFTRRLLDTDWGIQSPVSRSADPQTRWVCCGIGNHLLFG